MIGQQGPKTWQGPESRQVRFSLVYSEDSFHCSSYCIIYWRVGQIALFIILSTIVKGFYSFFFASQRGGNFLGVDVDRSSIVISKTRESEETFRLSLFF